MLVIGTHNGGRHLIDCLDSLEEYGNPLKTLVVDTNSDSPEHLEILKSVPDRYHWVTVETSKYGQYELGSIRHAFFEHSPDFLLFIHDTMSVKESDWWLPFESRLGDFTVVPWITFNPVNIDNPAQASFIRAVYGVDVNPNFVGIFGSCFCVPRGVLEAVASRGWMNFECTDKNMAMAMERAWPLAFAGVKAKIDAVFPMNLLNIVSYIQMGHSIQGTRIPCFKKTVLGRG